MTGLANHRAMLVAGPGRLLDRSIGRSKGPRAPAVPLAPAGQGPSQLRPHVPFSSIDRIQPSPAAGSTITPAAGGGGRPRLVAWPLACSTHLRGGLSSASGFFLVPGDGSARPMDDCAFEPRRCDERRKAGRRCPTRALFTSPS
jgi:hypothetical protein